MIPRIPLTARLFAITTLALSLSPQTAFAQEAHDHHAASTAQTQALWSEGEVRKLDKGQLKVTLKHGPLENLSMEAMTMVFRLTSAELLTGLAPGMRIRFRAEEKNGQLYVAAWKPAP